MSDSLAHQPNRSARRQLSLAQNKKERKVEKKLMKNAPNSVRFNSKKSRKVVPFNSITKSLIEKDTANIITPEKKNTNLTEINVPVATDKCNVEISAKTPKNAPEVNLSGQQGNKEEKSARQHEPSISSPPHEKEEEEETLKEISHQSTTNEESNLIKKNLQKLSMKDKPDFIINQDKIVDIKDATNDKLMNDTVVVTTVTSATPITDELIGKKVDADTQPNLVTTTTANDETNINDTNKEIKEIKKNNQEEETDQEQIMLQKETTPAPSMTTSVSISDKISPSTSASSNKRKSSLISRLFKNKNSSKKDISLIQALPSLNETSPKTLEKEKKPKAWKIWKKL